MNEIFSTIKFGIQNPDVVKEIVGAQLDALPDYEKKYAAGIVGTLLGQGLNYLLFRRLKAPRWAAVGFATVLANQSTARVTRERDQARQEAEAAKPEVDVSFLTEFEKVVRNAGN